MVVVEGETWERGGAREDSWVEERERSPEEPDKEWPEGNPSKKATAESK